MKIIKDDTIYVQVKDLRQLNESNNILSHSILYSIYLKFSNFNNYNDDEFIAFNNKDAYFNNITWIINFDDIKMLFEDEIIDICNKLIYERNVIADKYNALSPKARVKSRYMFNKSKILEYQINSYKDIIKIMHGNKKIELPDGIEFPPGFIKENKIKSLFKKIL